MTLHCNPNYCRVNVKAAAEYPANPDPGAPRNFLTSLTHPVLTGRSSARSCLFCGWRKARGLREARLRNLPDSPSALLNFLQIWVIPPRLQPLAEGVNTPSLFMPSAALRAPA